MRRKIFILMSVFLLMALPAETVEEVTLTTIAPSQDILRARKGAIGTTYKNPATLSDASIPESVLLVEGQINMGDSASAFGGSPLVIANTYIAPASGNTTVSGDLGLGVASIGSYGETYTAMSNNIAWVAAGIKYLSNGGGHHFLMTTKPWGIKTPFDISTNPQYIFRIAPKGAKDGVVDGSKLETMMVIAKGATIISSSHLYGGASMAEINPVSDIRLKKDIITIPDAVTRINSIRGVNFRWKDTKGDQSLHAGVIAQEVEKVFPELVRADKDGIKSVSYEEFVGVLIEAVKDLKKENDELRRQSESLENIISALEKDLGKEIERLHYRWIDRSIIMKKLLLLAGVICTLSFLTAEAKELTLTTFMPRQDITRVAKGAIGVNYKNLPDASIPANTLMLEGQLSIGDGGGPLKDANLNIASYVDHPELGHILHGGMRVGVSGFGSWATGYSAMHNNLVWLSVGSPIVKYLSAGGGHHFLMSVNPWPITEPYDISNDPQYIFRIAPKGLKDQEGNFLETMMVIAKGATIISSSHLYGGASMAEINPVSDIRLKKDIITIPDAVTRINSIRGVNFRWKDTKGDQSLHAGVIAQEVEKVFPELVRADKDGIKSVSYEEFVGVLIEAVKDLKKENDELRMKQGSIKNRAELLQDKIAQQGI